jgi:FkbM family methyltransferase
MSNVPPVPAYELTRRFRSLLWLAIPIRVLKNPTAAYAMEMTGSASELQFETGLKYRLGHGERRLSRELINLAYQGACLKGEPSSDATSWWVDSERRSITTPSGIRFGLDTIDSVVLAETYLYDIHFAGYDLSGNTVVDIGANIGDTALYFAERGARVLAFEPEPTNYGKLLQNLALNPRLASRIQAFEEAVGVDGTVALRAGLRGESGLYESGGTALPAHSVSLRTILERAGEPHPFLLKADCKGSEFDILRQQEVRQFDQLAVEYAARTRQRSVSEILELVRNAGFSKTRLFKHNWFPNYLDHTGMVTAQR